MMLVKRETVKVLAEHIAAGVRGDPRACPIYLAMCEHFGTSRVQFHFGNDSQGIRKLIAHYDATGEMLPFEFTAPHYKGVVQPGVPR